MGSKLELELELELGSKQQQERELRLHEFQRQERGVVHRWRSLRSFSLGGKMRLGERALWEGAMDGVAVFGSSQRVLVWVIFFLGQVTEVIVVVLKVKGTR